MEKILINVQEFNQLIKQMEGISLQLEKLNKSEPLTEKWFDNQDVCLLLKISPRCLQNYRDKGILPFSQFNKKIYYKASDIEKHLEKNYIKYK
jgi:hypothetical protein